MSRTLSGAGSGAVVLLAAWLGAALFFSAVVAPAAFRLLSSRSSAGALVGGTLPVLFLSGIIVGIVAAVLAGSMPRDATRMLSLACALGAGACCAIGLYLDHRIEALRAGAPEPMDALAPGDPIRQAFGRLHGLSVLALGAAMLLAIVALGALARRRTPIAQPIGVQSARTGASSPRES